MDINCSDEGICNGVDLAIGDIVVRTPCGRGKTLFVKMQTCDGIGSVMLGLSVRAQSVL